MATAPNRDDLPLVLLVDADLMLRRSFERITRRFPIRLVMASTAAEALALVARDGPPALLISAYHLADRDGLSLLEKVGHEHPGARLVLSSGTNHHPAPASGISLLPKPVDREALARLIESLSPVVTEAG